MEKEKNNTESIVEAIAKLIPDIHKENIALEISGMYADLFEEDKKHTDSEHEISIKVVFQVFSLNEKSQVVKSPKIIENNYYIPLPHKEDYDKYINLFNEFLQDTIKKTSENFKNK
jgi:hypothetical protein